jgi:NADP-dependent 3-hydroxy acid dehydrogenase YdfG
MRTPLAVLITGCSSGIGRATALEAASAGHEVFACARTIETVVDLKEHARIHPLVLDVTDVSSIRSAVASMLATAGRVDALVNNAGYGQYGAVEDVSLAEWRLQFEVNLFGAVAVTQAVLPAMREARRGTIVNVSSVAGKVAIPFSAPYCSSKHALEAVSDALRVEAAPFGIRVVVVEAGPIASRFAERARADFYREAERAMDTDFQAGMLPAERVARVIVRAIESSRPKTRYLITRMARVLIPLRRLLSDRFFDRRMKKTLRIPDRI